jgi:hypothetical protein
MTFVKLAVSAAALSLTLGATAALAQTEEPTQIGCLHMAKKASAALDANQSNAAYADARKQAQGAQSFCASGMYKNGIDGYAKVLTMLGAGN